MGVGRPVSAQVLEEWRWQTREAWARHGLKEGRDYYATLVAGVADPEEDKRLARAIVQSRPDLIIVNGAGWAGYIKQATSEIPIVFWDVSGPVLHGLVKSFQRPGGNITGVASGLYESMIKRIELLKEVRPSARRVAWVAGAYPKSAQRPSPRPFKRELSATAVDLGLELIDLPAPPDMDLDELAQALDKARADGFIPYTPHVRALRTGVKVPHPMIWLQQKCSVPGFYVTPEEVHAGGFASFGAQLQDQFDLMLEISIRVLRGERPATIPVHQPTRFHSALNLKTARALGIDVPAAVLLRVDELIR